MEFDLTGLYWIDGIDTWQAYGLIVEIGSADFLRFPATKETIKYDWPDQNGIDVDLSKIYLKERTGTLQCVIAADSEAAFFAKHDAFLARLVQPGVRRLTIMAHGNRSYYVYYKESGNYTQIQGAKLNGIDQGNILHRFSITLVEPNPQLYAFDTQLVSEEAFIIT